MTTPPAPASLRLFLGLWPPPHVNAALAAHAQQWAWPAKARRTVPDQAHVTLHFLGEVASERVAQLRGALDVGWAGCEMVLDEAAVWPGGIAVLEATRVPAPLAMLHAQLGERLLALGIAVESRRYRPHVTLARKAFGARPPAAFTPLRWQAGTEYALVRSLAGQGYETLQSFG